MMPSEFATFLPICAIGFVDKFKSLHKRKRAKMRVLKFDLTRPARTHTYTHAHTYLHHAPPCTKSAANDERRAGHSPRSFKQ